MLLEEPIERAAAALGAFLSSENPGPAYLSTPHEFSENFKLGDVLQIGEADNENKTESQNDSFEGAIEGQKTGFIVLAALTRVVDSLVLEIQKSEEQVQLGLLPESHLLAICKLCLLLEWQIQSIRAGTYPSSKADFFSLLQLVLELLFTISLSHISHFWDFLELRIGLLKSHVFDKNVTLHRIALLGLCNGLTDKYYVRNSLGKLDSYAKDTFNDEFQARVRMFLASMLSFDDLTGLNKYFAIANRESKEPLTLKTRLSDDNLLRDLVSFHRLLRNPFGYLRTPRVLLNLAGGIEKLAAYLLEQEAKYARNHPERDVYSVEPQQLAEEIAEATEKLKKIVFVPENYWLSVFDLKKDDAVMIEDQDTVLKQLDSLAFRRLLLIHIYLVASFFVELLGANKMSLLKSTGAPTATTTLKHLCEEVTPIEAVRVFSSIRRDILLQSKGWDTQLSFLLLTLSQSEEHWWSWLLYGKDKQGQPLLADRPLTDEDLSRTQEKLTTSLPFKTKRYFNTHATPQLSRKMKTKTGLNLLVRDSSDTTDYATLIDDLSSQIEEAKLAGDLERERELFEERTVLHWKRLKEKRLNLWLKLGESLNPDDIKMKRPVEKPIVEDSEDVEMEDVNGSETAGSEAVETKAEEDNEKEDEKDEPEGPRESGDIDTKVAEGTKETEEASPVEHQDIESKGDGVDALTNEVDKLAEKNPEDVPEPAKAPETPLAETPTPETGRELRKRSLSVDEEERPKRRRR